MENFSSRKQVVHWLQAQGFKISVPRIYKDAKKGLLIVEPDGTVRKEAVDRYIKAAGLQQPAAQSVEAAVQADLKTAEEIRQLKLKNAKLEHDLGVTRGKYVLKSEAHADEANLAALLDAVPRHVLMLNLPRYLSAIGADTTKAKLFFELFDADFTREINAICGDGEAEMIGADLEYPDDDE